MGHMAVSRWPYPAGRRESLKQINSRWLRGRQPPAFVGEKEGTSAVAEPKQADNHSNVLYDAKWRRVCIGLKIFRAGVYAFGAADKLACWAKAVKVSPRFS